MTRQPDGAPAPDDRAKKPTTVEDEDDPILPTAALAATFAANWRQLIAAGTPARQALMLAASRDKAGAAAYHLFGDSIPVPAQVVTLSRGQSFDDLVVAHAAAHKISLAQAVRVVAAQHPDLAAAR